MWPPIVWRHGDFPFFPLWRRLRRTSNAESNTVGEKVASLPLRIEYVRQVLGELRNLHHVVVGGSRSVGFDEEPFVPNIELELRHRAIPPEELIDVHTELRRQAE